MPFRKRNLEVLSQPTQKRERANPKIYYPGKQYVYAGIFGHADIIQDLSIEEMRKGVAAGVFITKEAHDQRQPVYELNGEPLTEEDLRPEKRRKLEDNGKAISLTTWKNRRNHLNSKSIQKITDVDQAWGKAVELIPRLPSPELVKDSRYFYAHTDLVNELLAIPTVVFNKMGFRRLGKTTQVRKTDNPDEYKMWIHDIDRYTEWYMQNRLSPADETLMADQTEWVREDAQPVPAAKTTEFIHLPIYSLFVNSAPAEEQVNKQPEHGQADLPSATSASVMPESWLQETNLVASFRLTPSDESVWPFANSLPSDDVSATLPLEELFDLEDVRPRHRM